MLLVTFKNGNVPCRYFCNCRVNFKIAQGHLSNLRNTLRGVGSMFFMWLGLMSPVDFKKWPFRPVRFQGQ